jgi:hypothetical protein
MKQKADLALGTNGLEGLRCEKKKRKHVFGCPYSCAR